MARENGRVVRRFVQCVKGEHGDCAINRLFKNDVVVASCGCKCHAEVAAVIDALEKQFVEQPKPETLL